MGVELIGVDIDRVFWTRIASTNECVLKYHFSGTAVDPDQRSAMSTQMLCCAKARCSLKGACGLARVAATALNTRRHLHGHGTECTGWGIA
jgi:hypothetical protein